MKSVNLTNTKLHNARLPAWSSGLLEGVKLAGAEGWVPADKDLCKAKLKGADLSENDLSGVDFSSSDLQNANLKNSKLHDALLPWRSGLLEGVNWSGARFGGTKWVPADKDLHDVKLKGADLSKCDLSGVNLSASDLSCTLLSKANLSEANLNSTNLTKAQLQGSRLPAWSSGLLEGVKLAGAEGWVPANKDLAKAKLKGADMSDSDLSGIDLSNSDLQSANLSQANLQNANLTDAQLQGARLPAWSSGLMEGVKLAGARGWVPANKDLSNAKLKGADLSNAKLQGAALKGADLSKCDLSGADLSKAKLQGAVLKGADLSKCDLSGADLTGADLREAKLEGTNLRVTKLCGALLHAAKGARPATTFQVPGKAMGLFQTLLLSGRLSDPAPFRPASGQSQATADKTVACLSRSLKVGQSVVFALTAPRALTLQRVTLCNVYGDGSGDEFCGKTMEVQTGPSATGPWTSVVKFTSRQTKQEQMFAAAPDAPLLAGFVQVLVHDTYGGQACVKSMALEGEAWG
jgi:uncharacterized protein YjbI with pentapeptide repeats